MRNLFVFAFSLFLTWSASAQDATLPPATTREVLTLKGKGVQIYACRQGKWVFVAPAARLFDKDGMEIGTHGDGPVWHFEDGSSAFGQVIAKTSSPDAGSVPWLLLKTTTNGVGLLNRVELIRRSETKGGVAPGGACDAGVLVRVPYEATYTFYAAN